MKISATDLKKLKSRLLSKREEITGDVTKMESHALKAGEQDNSVDHMADFGTDNFEQFLTLGLIENNEKMLQEIDEALERIKKGTFGTCTHCSTPVSKARLRAIPLAAYCIECQKIAEERGLDTEKNEG